MITKKHLEKWSKDDLVKGLLVLQMMTSHRYNANKSLKSTIGKTVANACLDFQSDIDCAFSYALRDIDLDEFKSLLKL